MLPIRDRMETDVQRRAFCAVGELDRFTGQQLMFAVVETDRWQTRQIGIQRTDAPVVICDPGTAEPAVTKKFQKRPGQELVRLGVSVDCRIAQLKIEKRRHSHNRGR